MKKVFYCFCLVFSGCIQPENTITVALSLIDTTLTPRHYVKIEIVNHSSDNLFIPNLYNPLAIYKEDADISSMYNRLNWKNEEEMILSNIESHFNRLDVDSMLLHRQSEYQKAIAQLEWPIMYRLNPMDSIQDSTQWQNLKEMFDFFCSIKYMGFPIKSKDTLVFYQAIDNLFDKKGIPLDNLEIRFHRYQNHAYDFSDTVLIDGLKFYTPLLDTTVLGYKMYHGELLPLNALKLTY